jgi:hypothetical protein
MALDFSARASEAPLDFSARTKPKPKRNWQGEVTGAMANFNRGLGIGDELAAAGNTVANVFSGRVPLSGVGADYNRSMAEQRRIEDSYAADRPNAAALARGFGMAATAAVPAGNTANLFAQGGRAVNAARGATLAATQGATYAAVDRGSARERLAASSRAARDPLTLVLGAVGGGLASPRARQPRAVRPEVRALVDEGVQLTPGQMAGGAAKQIEDAATSVPILGSAISDARRRGVETFNRAALNRSLRPIGEELPEGVQSGHEAIAYAGDRISAGYRAALPEGGVRADPGFTEAVSALVPTFDTLTPANSTRLQNIVNERLTSRLGQDGRLTGEMYQRVVGELENEARRFSRSTDADEQAMAEAITGVTAALREAAARQNPAFGARIRQLNEAWANITRAETAAAAGKDPAGVFTPAQYDSAVRSGSDTVRRRGYARGQALGQDLSSAAKTVLPSQLNESGTATRGAVGMVLGGGAGIVGGPVGLAATAGGLAIAGRAYSPQAIAAANRALAQNIAARDQAAALAELQQIALNDPSVQELYRQVAARLSRAAGVAGGSQAGQSPNLFAQP